MLPKLQDFLSYYHVTITLGATKYPMGRVSHMQVIDLPADAAPEGITHAVRFYDGKYHRELMGSLALEADGVFALDMGRGKTYRFRKQEVGDCA